MNPISNIMKHILLMLLIFSAVACAKKDNDSQNITEDPLFKVWQNDSYTLDLSKGHFGQFPAYFQNGLSTCLCTVSVTGFIGSGDFKIKFCNSNSQTTANCSALEKDFTYSNSEGDLYICESLNPSECTLLQ